MPTRWVGIDEAGYGPNLGPLVMTAVVAVSPDNRPPDVWSDLAATVDRAGGALEKLWVDDSKKIHKPEKGRDRLETTCLAAAAEISGGMVPATLGDLLVALGAGSLDDVEVSPWLDAGDPALTPRAFSMPRPFASDSWRIETIRTVVVGPSRFNAGLDRLKANKAKVHFEAFAELVTHVWDLGIDGAVTHILGDKHGGRHYYHEPLLNVFPDAWIDRGLEGPDLSRYTIRERGRRIELALMPRADAGDGLVALASMVSKAIREYWMDVFNAHWCSRLPDLKPTAGYPVDAARFRQAIEPFCERRGLDRSVWWRAK